MINNSNITETNRGSTQGTSPLKEKIASSPIGKTKLKQYGKQSLSPLVDLLHKYKDQINPYMLAMDKGLEGACNSFSNSFAPNNSPTQSFEAEQVVSGWFREAADWFKGAREKMSTEDPKDLLNYLEAEARNRPGLMFATSYVAGLVFGRLGRHIGRIKAKNTMSSHGQASLQH